MRVGRVGRDENLFELGGDSLVAAQITGRILEEVPQAAGLFFDQLLRQVLEQPTVAALAGHIEAETAAPVVAAPAGDTPPAPAGCPCCTRAAPARRGCWCRAVPRRPTGTRRWCRTSRRPVRCSGWPPRRPTTCPGRRRAGPAGQRRRPAGGSADRARPRRDPRPGGGPFADRGGRAGRGPGPGVAVATGGRRCGRDRVPGRDRSRGTRRGLRRAALGDGPPRADPVRRRPHRAAARRRGPVRRRGAGVLGRPVPG
nr:phosphopantetheine-binding protein [Micromonospora tarapacensis]